jgi:hypothetical protein
MKIHVQLQKAKSSHDSFGGVNVLFFGCMLQLPVVSNYPLYVRYPQWEKGHELWRSLNAVIILTQQMRQSEDPVYAGLLSRLRMHIPTPEDIKLLQSRIGAPLPESAPIAIIVRRNSLLQAINDRKLHLTSEMTGTPITYCIADVIDKGDMSMAEVRQIKTGDFKCQGQTFNWVLRHRQTSHRFRSRYVGICSTIAGPVPSTCVHNVPLQSRLAEYASAA